MGIDVGERGDCVLALMEQMGAVVGGVQGFCCVWGELGE